MSDEPRFESIWVLWLRARGLPEDTPYPRDIRTAPSVVEHDPVRRCRQCGGHYFQAVLILAADGTPVRMLPPQTCVGCGAIAQHNWALDGATYPPQ